jgi:hypothetical protein
MQGIVPYLSLKSAQISPASPGNMMKSEHLRLGNTRGRTVAAAAWIFT